MVGEGPSTRWSRDEAQSLFLGTALLFWHSALRPRRRAARGTAVICLFATAVHTSALGVLMTFARGAWYAHYTMTIGASAALEDQRVAGLLMWIPGGIAYWVAALFTVRRWLADSEERVRRSEAAAVSYSV